MDTTDKELQTQFDERSRNLKHSMHNIVDSVDQAIHDVFDQEKSSNNTDSTSMFTSASGSNYNHDHRWSHTGVDSPLQQNMMPSDATVVDNRSATSNTTTSGVSQEQNPLDETSLATERMGYRVNQSAMHAIERDIQDMHKANAEGFEPVAAKFEETFGNSALTDRGPDRSDYNF